MSVASSSSPWSPERLFENISGPGGRLGQGGIFALSDAQTFALGTALFLIGIALIYYVMRFTAKALSWAVTMCLRVGVAMLAIAIAMILLSALFPWAATQLGIEDWLPQHHQRGGASSLLDTATLGGGLGVDYIELEVDSTTGERVRMPKWSQAAEREMRSTWHGRGRRILEGMFGHDMAEAVWEGRKSGWAWVGIKYGATKSARAAVDMTWSVLSGVASTVASLARSAGEPTLGEEEEQEGTNEEEQPVEDVDKGFFGFDLGL